MFNNEKENDYDDYDFQIDLAKHQIMGGAVMTAGFGLMVFGMSAFLGGGILPSSVGFMALVSGLALTVLGARAVKNDLDKVRQKGKSIRKGNQDDGKQGAPF